jgi:hypothetical protein
MGNHVETKNVQKTKNIVFLFGENRLRRWKVKGRQGKPVVGPNLWCVLMEKKEREMSIFWSKLRGSNSTSKWNLHFTNVCWFDFIRLKCIVNFIIFMHVKFVRLN